MDKELALTISEMLIKQDETTLQVSNVVNQIQETNSILRDFMGISVKQWEEQHKFNEVLIGEVREIKDAVKTFSQIDARVKSC